MNERIRELAEQAGFGLRRDGEIYTSRLEHLPITEDIEKFAELIVRECANIAYRCSPADCYSGDEFIHAGDRMKQHFGVEE